MRKNKNINISRKTINDYILNIVGDCEHAKRILSLGNAVEGVIYSSSLAVSCIGRAFALENELIPKHAIKQIDRFFSNKKILLNIFFANWIRYHLKNRTSVILALDWTDFDKDNQCTLSLNMITNHGRATPLLWKTYIKSELKDNRNSYEDEMLSFLKINIPVDCNVTILADRGFCDTAFFSYIKDELEFDYIIRIKNNIIMNVNNNIKPVQEWLIQSGNARKYENVTLTHNKEPVSAVVCVHNKKMKEAWFLATSFSGKKASEIVNLYGKRFTIEENFRDIKNIRFGMGLSSIRVSNPERRDRILMASAIAIALITVLGAAGEAIGLDKQLKANTVKRRTHSLFNQGLFYFQAMIRYKNNILKDLINKFIELINQEKVFNDIFGLV